MPKKKYIVSLTESDKLSLKELINKGESKARVIKHANVLLLSDKGSTDKEIEENINVTHQTIYTIRKRYCEEGLKAALEDKPRPGKPPIIIETQIANITAMACSEPPEGRSRWSLRLLTDRIIELGIVESISHEEVRRILKKTNCVLT